MAAEGDIAPVEGRKAKILAAAFDCLVRYGYSKVTMQDIAAAAHVSRPLIYTLYSGKEDVFLHMFSAIFDEQLRRIEGLAAADLTTAAKLEQIFDIVMMEMWARLTSSPENSDLLDAADRLFPKIGERYRKRLIAMMAGVVGDPFTAEVLIMSSKGLCYDRPRASTLKKRLARLIEVFVARS